ncbi:MAG TPA: amidohydrolase family protein [Woeseiaceae bacterium]|nr:amidohydrolase family protein [Woeseiaceae bacterium]
MTRQILYFCAPFLTALPALAAAATTAFSGATILPIADEPIENGVLVIEDERILALGPAGDVDIPGDAKRVELEGGVIMPGLVDTHSHIGGVAGGDASDPIQPAARVLDSIDVRDSGFGRARAGGITTANLMPGSGLLMSGQTLYVKLRDGNTIGELAYKNEDGTYAGGMKMANGTNPIGEPPFPGTRAKSAALVRQRFIDAIEYGRKIEQAGGDEEKMPERDLGKEALLEVLNGERVVHFHTHRHDDILTALRLHDEFGFRIVLHHVSEAHRVADEIAEAGVPVSLILVDSPGGKLEAMHLNFKNPPIMEQAGVDVAFHTDDYITDSRLLLRMGAFGVRSGMSREGALEALTLAGARMLGLDERVGSLEPGKDADFVILSGDPFSVYTRVLETWVEGEKVFDLDDPEDREVAEGAYGAMQPSFATQHGFDGYGEGHR